MKVEIIDGCIACGMCTMICEKVFELGDDGYAHVIDDPKGLESEVREAASSCPVEVIKVKES